VLGEEMARQFKRSTGIPFVGFRYSNIMERAGYERFPSYWDDPHARKWNLWSYVDESHVGQSTRRALEAEIAGAETFVIAAADTVMQQSSSKLMAEVFPGVPIRKPLGEHETLLGIDKARAMLAYEPTFTWRNVR
jgi:nucleoside-diphosphate-sugar epimerase